jgi:hypothetical protein
MHLKLNHCPSFQCLHFIRRALAIVPCLLATGFLGTSCAKGPKWEQIPLDNPVEAYRSDSWTLRSVVQIEQSGAGLSCVVRSTRDATATSYGGLMFPGQESRALRIDMALTEPESIISVFVDGYDAQKKRVVRWQANSRDKLRLDRVKYVFLPQKPFDGFNPVASEGTGRIHQYHVFVSVKPGGVTAFNIYGVEVSQ